MIFVRAAADIGRLYFWNLTGSGAGGAAMTGLMWLFPPSALPGLAAAMALTAALLVLPEGLQGPASSPGGIAGPGRTPSSRGRCRPDSRSAPLRGPLRGGGGRSSGQLSLPAWPSPSP